MNRKRSSSNAILWCKRIAKVILLLFLLIFTGIIGWSFGILQASTPHSGINHDEPSEFALKSTGLPIEYAPGFSLHGYTGFRDSYSQTEFCINYQRERQELLDIISTTDYWHITPVTASEYSDFASSVMWEYENSWLYSDEIIFDAWYYREIVEPHTPNGRIPKGPMEEIGSYIGRGFEFALFDVDTGLFVYIDQFG